MLRESLVEAGGRRADLEDDADAVRVHLHAPHEGQDELPLGRAVGPRQALPDGARELLQAPDRQAQLGLGDLVRAVLLHLRLQGRHALPEPLTATPCPKSFAVAALGATGAATAIGATTKIL